MSTLFPRAYLPRPREIFKAVPDVFKKVVENIVAAPLRIKIFAEKLGELTNNITNNIPDVVVLKKQWEALKEGALFSLQKARENLTQKLENSLPPHIIQRRNRIEQEREKYNDLLEALNALRS